MNLRKRVKEFLKDTGSTVTNFCKKIGVSTTYYYKWINENVEISDALMQKIENYLDEVYAK